MSAVHREKVKSISETDHGCVDWQSASNWIYGYTVLYNNRLAVSLSLSVQWLATARWKRNLLPLLLFTSNSIFFFHDSDDFFARRQRMWHLVLVFSRKLPTSQCRLTRVGLGASADAEAGQPDQPDQSDRRRKPKNRFLTWRQATDRETISTRDAIGFCNHYTVLEIGWTWYDSVPFAKKKSPPVEKAPFLIEFWPERFTRPSFVNLSPLLSLSLPISSSYSWSADCLYGGSLLSSI